MWRGGKKKIINWSHESTSEHKIQWFVRASRSHFVFRHFLSFSLYSSSIFCFVLSLLLENRFNSYIKRHWNEGKKKFQVEEEKTLAHTPYNLLFYHIRANSCCFLRIFFMYMTHTVCIEWLKWWGFLIDKNIYIIHRFNHLYWLNKPLKHVRSDNTVSQ